MRIRSLRSPVPTWLFRSSAILSCCSLTFRSSSRARRTLRPLALFLCWDFSSWQETTRPVGRWVMRTAESVVLTLCPPGPEERNTSTRSSSGSIWTSTSSASGRYGYRHGGGVETPLGFGGRDPLNPMDPAFVFQLAVSPFPFHRGDDFLEAAHAGGMIAHDLHPPAHDFSILGVHPKQVGGKQGRFLAPGSGPDLEEDILIVEGVFGQQQDLDFFFHPDHLIFQRLDFISGQFADLRVRVFQQSFVVAQFFGQGLELTVLPMRGARSACSLASFW